MNLTCDLGKLYRYQEITYAAPLDEFENPIGVGMTEVKLREYPITKKTEKGVWIGGYDYKDKFVNLNTRKKFACPTIEEAKESFIARKRAQIRIMNARMKTAVIALGIMESMIENVNPTVL
jgi:hypothetical protein